MENKKNNNSTPNRVRNRWVGFATLLLILAAVAPSILTDKSNLPISSTPILQPEIVNQQNQVMTSPTESGSQLGNPNNEVADIPYIPEDDQNSNTLSSNNISTNDDSVSSVNNKSVVSSQETKPYMIQLTALKNRQKIEELVALLRLNNYNVRLIPKNPEPNQLIKLQIGPYAKREQAEQVIVDLDTLTKLKGIIVAN
ncbi:SPOR domain-containing protein [Gilliamella sp. B3464]|uniref:SPOR domain-containing protein n=1 Tax=unclassified Gilliamella TaxID=2685620 RepID=UPI00226A57D7|nr:MULTISPECIES: SPOR domain-containing protein [unclassified Gilliamella]MCX8711884.1 SPOR domain-containing protein [Gilliamella sp. B3468]MCX8727883.1 SPOR domain-containing protein [Gilliamella sp. B2838]MCX8750934.1 SPOR domain-containing protein [Gilliamella sp. B3464]